MEKTVQHRVQESRVRSNARRLGYSVRKSRAPVGFDNFGDFMLLAEDNFVVLGSRFDATLDEIEECLAP
jgi:hypothetical protein